MRWTTTQAWRRGAALVVAGVLALGGCASPDQNAVAAEPPAEVAAGEAGTPSLAPDVTTPSSTPPPAPTSAPPGPAAGAGIDIRAVLAPLRIDDGPPAPGYRRELFPHWEDTDGDGCDGRQQALIAASDPPATVARNCEVAGGSWFSDYDGLRSTSPGELDVDHVVPLADAWRRGADRWPTDQRTRFANDPRNLWPVSAASNRSKSDDGPDRWRPPRRESWCRYAFRWVEVKVAYDLGATTAERDALGQMLETCTAVPGPGPGPSPSGPVATVPAPTTPPASAAPTAPAPPTVPPAPSAPSGGEPYYKNCAEARAAGAAPLHRGEPGYRPQLDGDEDGIACE